MLSIPQPQDSGSKIDVLRNKAIDLYKDDLGYQQNINDAFLIMKMAEKTVLCLALGLTLWKKQNH